MEKDNDTLTISMPSTLKAKALARSIKGEFGNTSEYVRTLIRHDLEQQGKLENLRRLVAEGEEALNRGEFAAFNQQLVDQIKAQGRDGLAASDR